MNITYQTVESLKEAGHYFAAGALAQSLGHIRVYGCHIGTRSSKARAEEAFYRGYDLSRS